MRAIGWHNQQCCFLDAFCFLGQLTLVLSSDYIITAQSYPANPKDIFQILKIIKYNINIKDKGPRTTEVQTQKVWLSVLSIF